MLTPVESVLDALSKMFDKVKLNSLDGDNKPVTAAKLELPFNSFNGEPFRLYVFQIRLNKSPVNISDGGALLRTLRGCGELRLKSLQDVLATFGLSLMEDLSIMAVNVAKKDIPTKVRAFIQAWCTIDGIIRTWKVTQEEVKDGLRSARQSSSNDEVVWAAGSKYTEDAN